MFSCKPGGNSTACILAMILLFCVVPPVVSMPNGQFQHDAPAVIAQANNSFGTGQPWTDSAQTQNQQNFSGYQNSGSAQQFSSSPQPYGSAPQSYSSSPQPYSPPQGGYSAPYSYAGSTISANYGPGIMPSFPPQGQGIISSHAQASVLPDGLVLPIQLDTTIDTNKTEEGDPVQAHITQNVSSSGVGYLPGGSQFAGTVVKAPEEGHFGRSGKFGIEFTQVRFPNGNLVPIKAHLVGRIGTYIYRPEGSRGGNLMNTAWRDGVGSEMGRGLGTMLSVGSGSGYGPGNGAYVGAFMSGTSQLLDSIFLHRHHDTYLHPGTKMELQLDGPLELPGFSNRQTMPGTGRNTGIF